MLAQEITGLVPALIAGVVGLFGLVVFAFKWLATNYEKSMATRDAQSEKANEAIVATQRELVVEIRALANSSRETTTVLREVAKKVSA